MRYLAGKAVIIGESEFQMSLQTFYSGIVARDKPGSPTVEEARRDFLALLGVRSIPARYV